MCWCYLKEDLEMLKTVLTCLGILGAGGWALYLYLRQRENHPRVEMSADIVFHKRIHDWWIAELIVYIENKGKVQHRLHNLDFTLDSIEAGDQLQLAQQFGNQAYFPHRIAKGSFKNSEMDYFFLEPGVKGKYSYLTRVSTKTEAVLLHAFFDYPQIDKAHGTEITAVVPKQKIEPNQNRNKV